MKIARVASHAIDVGLREPFGIAGGAQAAAHNVLVSVTLDGGVVGWGEAAPFPAFNGETRELALAAVERARERVVGHDAREWRALAADLRAHVPESPSARCAIETAVIDALARSERIALYQLFGGGAATLETDCTITTGTVADALEAAARIAAEGFRTIKIKVGGRHLDEDEARVRAVLDATPAAVRVILDGNAGLASADDALRLARAAGERLALFEQPLAAADLDGARAVLRECGAPVAADEAVTTADDVHVLADAGACSVVNVKIMKSGIAEALHIVAAAHERGIGLMIGGLVETQLAMTVSACLAAGAGGFSFVDLDTPLWMIDPPLVGGAVWRGPKIELGGVRAGHGVVPAEDAKLTAT